MCLACLGYLFQEVGVASASTGDRVGEEFGGGMEDQVTWGLIGHHEDLGFSSEQNGELVQGNDAIRLTQ